MNLPSQLSLWLENREKHHCHRQLLVISGSQTWTTKILQDALNNLPTKDILWVGEAQKEIETIRVADYRSRLGREYSHLIFDCFSGFRANAAMALSGTIKAQGLMIMLCPAFTEWPYFADPEILNRTSYGYSNQAFSSNFFQYLSSAFEADDAVAILTEESFYNPISKIEKNDVINPFAEQQLAVQQICKLAKGRANRPLVISADRGRGKSSSLGIAAATLMQQQNKKIWVTAPQVGNTSQIFHHAEKLLPETQKTKHTLSTENSVLMFKPVDQLLLGDESIDLLMVDEAAAIPIHILLKLQSKFPRVVFSSTVHGYEGSGRGFELKFSKELKKQTPSYKSLQLTQPIRWEVGDVLEQFWFKTLFHKLDRVEQATVAGVLTIQELAQAEMLSSPKVLEKAFKLSLDAHYQTSPDDLQRLLDSPEIKCFALISDKNVLGVAQIVIEGGPLLNELADRIANGSRRVRGHLTTQSLAHLYNLPEFCKTPHWRISRIAIAPRLQRQGLGTKFIQLLEKQAINNNISLMSTAFGANLNLLRFWSASGFKMTKISTKPEISSGEHSCICLKSLSTESKQVETNMRTNFSSELIFNLHKDLKCLPTGIALKLLREASIKHEDCDLGVLNQFVAETRALSSCKRQIYQFLLQRVGDLSLQSKADWPFLVAFAFQNKSNSQLCCEFNLTGKKQIAKKVQDNLKILLMTT